MADYLLQRSVHKKREYHLCTPFFGILPHKYYQILTRKLSALYILWLGLILNAS